MFFFCFERIRTLVVMATYASHRLKMEKSENFQFLLSCCRYLNFVFAEMFIEKSSTFHVTCVLILHFDWLQGPHIGQNFEKNIQNLLLRNCQEDEVCTLYTCS